MDFTSSHRLRRPRENIVPMINVVFLLLIFFLMSARIAPPDPFEVTLPRSETEAQGIADQTLYVSADGKLAFRGKLDAAALADLAQSAPAAPLLIRADARLPALQLATILRELGQIGITDVTLVTGGG